MPSKNDYLIGQLVLQNEQRETSVASQTPALHSRAVKLDLCSSVWDETRVNIRLLCFDFIEGGVTCHRGVSHD